MWYPRRIEAAMSAASDPWDAATAGMDAFLDVCAEPDYREIVLLQGPIALGRRRRRELDRRHLGHLLVSATRSLVDGGLVQDHPGGLLAAAIYGSRTELSLAVADSDAPETDRADAARLARGLLAGLAP
ncbi:hypothetical protein [Spirillospora sp. CA-294931]|uniref:hypothetical protein n=1 Tax=Spirillospora sp. CA-294931 TaxID=3240042 RepID=UPI003D8F7C4C